MADTTERKLAVLLHADVVGSTALVQANEILAHERIQDVFRRFSETITSNGGTAREIRGDALVAEFAKASDAVTAATTFQETNAVHNKSLPDELRPIVRVGIAIGEVVIADNTVTGEGIVLAQRLEQLSEPGGVCIQDAAYQTVPKRLAFSYENLGERTVKGFDEPVRAYAVSRALEAPTAEPVAATDFKPVSLDLPEKPSIAVLPFANMSGDPEQEYFSDGITEDIITALSHVAGLLVVARNSTMVYKGKAVDVKQVGREQGVRYVLEGSVRKSGARVRVTAQLIDATTGHHQWAEHYDRELDDIFSVQDEIKQRIIVEMRVQVSEGEKARMLAGGTRNLTAWECLLRADDLNMTLNREDNHEALRFAEEAVRLDPNYASAWTELGWVHWSDLFFGWTQSAEQSEIKAKEAAEKALELVENYPNAFSLLGLLALARGEHDKAVELTERARYPCSQQRRMYRGIRLRADLCRADRRGNCSARKSNSFKSNLSSLLPHASWYLPLP